VAVVQYTFTHKQHIDDTIDTDNVHSTQTKRENSAYIFRVKQPQDMSLDFSSWSG